MSSRRSWSDSPIRKSPENATRVWKAAAGCSKTWRMTVTAAYATIAGIASACFGGNSLLQSRKT